MHHADAGRDGVKRRGKLHFFPVYEDVSPVAAGLRDHVGAEENAHKCRLAGAIFSDKADDFAFSDREVDVRQHLISEEILADIPHLKERCLCFVHVLGLP